MRADGGLRGRPVNMVVVLMCERGAVVRTGPRSGAKKGLAGHIYLMFVLN